MALFSKGLHEPRVPLSRTSSFSAASSSASSLKHDNSTMVTSRNLQCMPSDDEDDLDDDEPEQEDDDDDDDDNLLLCDTLKKSFTSVNSEHRRRQDNTKNLVDNGIDRPQRQQQQTKVATNTNHHLQKQKQQYRHSIGLPIKNSQHFPHPNDKKPTAHHHLKSSSSHPSHHRSHRPSSKSPMPVPLLSMDPTTPPLTPTSTNQPLSFATPSNQNYLRHRSSLSGVDLIMAREQLEQKKKKNKPIKKWDSTRAPIGGLLAQLPQQGQHTISFQQQQLQLQQQQLQFQQQQQMQYNFQQQQHQQRNPHLMLPPSLLVLPRSPTSNMSRW